MKFILADVAPGQRDSEKAAITLTGDAGAVAAQLSKALESASGFDTGHYQDWTKQLTEKVQHLCFQHFMRVEVSLHLYCVSPQRGPIAHIGSASRCKGECYKVGPSE